MEKEKRRAVVLLIQVLILIVIYIGIPFIERLNVTQKKLHAMVMFNELVDSKVHTNEMLKYLKVLINNFESLTNVEILDSRDLNKLQEECNRLKPNHIQIFLYYSTKMNLAILGSILLPGLSYAFKTLKKKKTVC
ncbi:hypothetical protein GINT2_000119 [Glugoides intestinalis]